MFVSFIAHFRLDVKGALVEPKNRMLEGADDDRVPERQLVRAENTGTRRHPVAQRRSTATVRNSAAQCFSRFLQHQRYCSPAGGSGSIRVRLLANSRHDCASGR